MIFLIEIECTHAKPATGSSNCTEGQIAFGDSCTFICSEGYAMSGNATTTCTGTAASNVGTWSPAEPTCVGE